MTPDAGGAAHDELDRLVTRHMQAVYRQMLRVCGNQAGAEDVLQDALLNAYRALGTFRDPAAFQAWLACIGRNVCYRLKRKEALRRILALPEGQTLELVVLDGGTADRARTTASWPAAPPIHARRSEASR